MTRRVKPRPRFLGPASLPDPLAFAVAVGRFQAGEQWALFISLMRQEPPAFRWPRDHGPDVVRVYE